MGTGQKGFHFARILSVHIFASRAARYSAFIEGNLTKFPIKGELAAAGAGLGETRQSFLVMQQAQESVYAGVGALNAEAMDVFNVAQFMDLMAEAERKGAVHFDEGASVNDEFFVEEDVRH
jgi:hypothetical protein